jgi:type III secretion protein C
MRFYKTVLYLCTLLCFSFLSNYCLAVAPAYWKDSAYAIECKNTSIREVLDDFASSFSVALRVSETVGGICDGWLRSKSAVDFLNQLEYSHKLHWYVYKNELYVSSADEEVTRKVKAGPDLKDALMGVGLYEKKFGWGQLGDKDIVLVAGPKTYVDNIEHLVTDIGEKKAPKSSPVKATKGDIYVIPLKYASVVDREIVVRGKSVYIPGVATILKGLLTNEKMDRFTTAEKRENSEVDSGAVIKPKKSEDLAIEADVRTNSIVINSTNKEEKYFTDIIKKLDIDQNLIEIDAVIVDINREKLQEIGIDLTRISNGNQVRFRNNVTGGLAAANIEATLLIEDFGKFFANLKLLEGKGDATIIANTTVLTMENQPAVIDLSETVFIKNVGERVANSEPVTAGTLLNIIPQAIETDQGTKINLVIDIEDGKVIQNSPQDSPSIRKTNISTKAIIDEKRSLVIGGYNRRAQESRTNQVPGLGKIPLAGALFRSQSQKTSMLERVFILTPRISPTQHNPQDYTSSDNKNAVSLAMKRIEQRWKQSNQSYVDKSLEAFKGIIEVRTPDGFYPSKVVKKEVNFRCKDNRFQYLFVNQPVLKGHGLEIYRGRVKNISGGVVTAQEKACFGKGLIAVTFVDEPKLSPNQWVTILVSVEAGKAIN